MQLCKNSEKLHKGKIQKLNHLQFHHSETTAINILSYTYIYRLSHIHAYTYTYSFSSHLPDSSAVPNDSLSRDWGVFLPSQ